MCVYCYLHEKKKVLWDPSDLFVEHIVTARKLAQYNKRSDLDLDRIVWFRFYALNLKFNIGTQLFMKKGPSAAKVGTQNDTHFQNKSICPCCLRVKRVVGNRWRCPGSKRYQVVALRPVSSDGGGARCGRQQHQCVRNKWHQQLYLWTRSIENCWISMAMGLLSKVVSDKVSGKVEANAWMSLLWLFLIRLWWKQRPHSANGGKTT